MKTLIIVLIIISFIQSTVFPIDLVLIFLICRAYLRSDENNLYLAFTFGLLISFLDLIMLGLQSIIYLMLIQLTQALSKSRLAGNSLLIIPVCLILLSLNQLILSIVTHQIIQFFPKIVLESLLSLPILYLIKYWEERFTVQKDIKLKV